MKIDLDRPLVKPGSDSEGVLHLVIFGLRLRPYGGPRGWAFFMSEAPLYHGHTEALRGGVRGPTHLGGIL